MKNARSDTTCQSASVQETARETLSVSHATNSKDEETSSPTPDIFQALKRRCVVMNEGDQAKSYNAAWVKRFTGGDQIPARDLYGGATQARPFYPKIFVLSNHAVHCKEGADTAFYERIYPISFDACFKKDIPEDTVVNGQHHWVGKCTTVMADYYKENAPLVMLILLAASGVAFWVWLVRTLIRLVAR